MKNRIKKDAAAQLKAESKICFDRAIANCRAGFKLLDDDKPKAKPKRIRCAGGWILLDQVNVNQPRNGRDVFDRDLANAEKLLVLSVRFGGQSPLAALNTKLSAAVSALNSNHKNEQNKVDKLRAQRTAALNRECRLLLKDLKSGVRHVDQYVSQISNADKKGKFPAAPMIDEAIARIQRFKGEISIQHAAAIRSFVRFTDQLDPEARSVVQYDRAPYYSPSYYSDNFSSPEMFKLWTQLVRHWGRVCNVWQMGGLAKAGLFKKKPSLTMAQRAEFRREYKDLQPAVLAAFTDYRAILNQTGSIDKAVVGTTRRLRHARSPLALKAFFSNLEKLLKETPAQKRLAPAQLTARLMALRWDQPELESRLLSGKML